MVAICLNLRTQYILLTVISARTQPLVRRLSQTRAQFLPATLLSLPYGSTTCGSLTAGSNMQCNCAGIAFQIYDERQLLYLGIWDLQGILTKPAIRVSNSVIFRPAVRPGQ